MNTIAKQVDAIRDKMLAGADFLTPLGELLERHGSDTIAPLLLIYDFPELMSDEKYAITHFIESFPREIFIATLLGTSPAMSKTNPSFLDFLIARLMNSPADQPLFRKKLGAAAVIEVEAIRDSLVRARTEYADKPTIVRSCEKMLASIASRKKS